VNGWKGVLVPVGRLHMLEDKKRSFIESVCRSLRGLDFGYFLTLDAITKDEILFESQIARLMHWLNVYCYGKNYKKNSKRLRIVGVTENGYRNNGLHMHLVLMHKNDTKRNVHEIDSFIRRKWYRLIGARGSIYGNLVDLQLIGNVNSRVGYMSKTFYQKAEDFNLLCF